MSHSRVSGNLGEEQNVQEKDSRFHWPGFKNSMHHSIYFGIKAPY